MEIFFVNEAGFSQCSGWSASLGTGWASTGIYLGSPSEQQLCPEHQANTNLAAPRPRVAWVPQPYLYKDHIYPMAGMFHVKSSAATMASWDCGSQRGSKGKGSAQDPEPGGQGRMLALGRMKGEGSGPWTPVSVLGSVAGDLVGCASPLAAALCSLGFLMETSSTQKTTAHLVDSLQTGPFWQRPAVARSGWSMTSSSVCSLWPAPALPPLFPTQDPALKWPHKVRELLDPPPPPNTRKVAAWWISDQANCSSSEAAERSRDNWRALCPSSLVPGLRTQLAVAWMSRETALSCECCSPRCGPWGWAAWHHHATCFAWELYAVLEPVEHSHGRSVSQKCFYHSVKHFPNRSD